jgi:hypothetical protein
LRASDYHSDESTAISMPLSIAIATFSRAAPVEVHAAGPAAAKRGVSLSPLAGRTSC